MRAKRDDVVTETIRALFQLWLWILKLGHDKLFKADRKFEHIRKGIVADVAFDQVQFLQCCLVGAFQRVKSTVIQFCSPNCECFKLGVRKNVNVLAKVPVPIIGSLVVKVACLQAGQIEWSVEEASNAMQQLVG